MKYIIWVIQAGRLYYLKVSNGGGNLWSPIIKDTENGTLMIFNSFNEALKLAIQYCYTAQTVYIGYTNGTLILKLPSVMPYYKLKNSIVMWEIMQNQELSEKHIGLIVKKYGSIPGFLLSNHENMVRQYLYNKYKR